MEFAPFPRLPAELRLKIWRFSFQTRIVNLRWSSDLRQYISLNIPALLHVSSEARDEGLKIYRPCFNTTFGSPSIVYFNFDLDIVRIDCSTLGRPPGRIGRIAADCAKVKILSIDNGYLKLHLKDGMELRQFEGLQELWVSGCDRGLLDELGDLEISGRALSLLVMPTAILPGTRGKLIPPKLKCSDLGVKCREHWWFRQCNELWAQRLQYWQKKFLTINGMARLTVQNREIQLLTDNMERLSGIHGEFMVQGRGPISHVI